MQRTIILPALALAALAGCSTANVESSPAPDRGNAIPADATALPAGTRLEVEMDETVGTENSRVGDQFRAHVDEAVVASDGSTVIPEGATVTGIITGLAEAENDNPAVIRLDFTTVGFDGRNYRLDASIVDVDVSIWDTVKSAKTEAGIGAAAGAALGAILGGDLLDVLVGGALGAGAGTAIALGLDDDASLPEGANLTIRTNERLALR
jgi:hypothetical protein